MAERIELIARGFICRARHVLLCRCLKHGYLYLPGGHVEFGESAADALVREFIEECGLNIQVGSLRAVSEGTFEQKGKRKHEVNLVFHVELMDVHGEQLPPVASLEEDIDFQWISLDEVAASDVRPRAMKSFLVNTPECGVSFGSDVREPG